MRIENDGPRIIATDYWQSEHAQRGLCWLSVNAGALRLLVPPAAHDVFRMLLDVPAEAPATMTLGQDRASGREVYSLVWDDGMEDSPYLLIDLQQSDRRIPDRDMGRPVPLTLYGRGPGGSVSTLGTWQARLRKQRWVG